MDHLTALLAPTAAAALSWATLRLVVPRLPEPAPDDRTTPGWAKPPYAGLAGPRNQVVAASAGLAAGLVCALEPAQHLPLLLPLAGPTAALVVTDQRTTYLPRWLTYFCGVLTALGAACASVLSADPAGLALRLVGGAVAAAAFFWLVWRIGAGLGFGDVRLAPLLGAGAVSAGWQAWWSALALGTLLGAVVGVLTGLWRRCRPDPLGNTFAYGPSLWAGLWLGLLLT